MAEVKKQARVIDSWKAKKWYKLISPQLFGQMQIGDTLGLEDAQLIGKTVTVSLMTITGDVKKQSTNATFEVTDVKSGSAQTKLTKLEIAPSSIRRMIRKGKERIDMSLVCATKDNVIVRVKPFLVTKGKAGNSVLTNMRAMADALVRVEASKVTFENLAHSILTNQLQRGMKQRLNKIYPLKTVEIRTIETTVATNPLPPVPHIEELKEEKVEETEEEKLEKKVKAKAAEVVTEEKEVVEKPKKVKAKKAEEAA